MCYFIAGVNPDTSTSSWKIHKDVCRASAMDIPPFAPVLRDSPNTPYIPDSTQVFTVLKVALLLRQFGGDLSENSLVLREQSKCDVKYRDLLSRLSH